ncbi:MAG: DUF4340 domain-containing protein [Deltaproteobacteria bacterium]|nr:DUF4340 domain-containing protein [Deltaproteobacteria bacterium]
MKIKREYIILGILIIILSMYLILRKQDRSFYDLPDIPSIVREDITKIEISKKDSSLTLNKINSTWHIAPEDYIADKDKISGMLDIIEKLSLTALVSESKNYGIYDLGDDKKITIKAWSSDGTLQREFELGKTAESYRHTHIKLPKDYRVYHANTNIRPKFDQAMEDLRDKNVLSFDKKEIKEIALIKQGKTYTFVKKEPEKTDDIKKPSDPESAAKPSEPVWKYIGKGSVDQKRLESLLDVVSKLKCDKYIYDKQIADFKYPAFTLVLKGNKEYFLKVFAKKSKDDKSRSCISSESTQPFEIPDYQANHFMESLLKK